MAGCAVFYEQQEARSAGNLQRAAAAGARLEELQARIHHSIYCFQATEMHEQINCQMMPGHSGHHADLPPAIWQPRHQLRKQYANSETRREIVRRMQAL